METFQNDELTDLELNEMLNEWKVVDSPQSLRARIFSEDRKASIALKSFAFEFSPKAAEPWRKSGAASVLIHAGVAALLLLAFQAPQMKTINKSNGRIVYVAPYRRPVSPAGQNARGGGGGGQRTPLPVGRGAAPQFAVKPVMPPAIAISKPALPIVPTITADAPIIVADQYGDPLAKTLSASGGPGVDGIGNGGPGGLGGGRGAGSGPGVGGGIGDGVYRIGGPVSAPVLILKVEPEYSEEARRAKFSGMVILSTVVDEEGIPREVHVVRSLGLGLDQKAIDAVSRWRFRPALLYGRAVKVFANVEVSFRLL